MEVGVPKRMRGGRSIAGGGASPNPLRPGKLPRVSRPRLLHHLGARLLLLALGLGCGGCGKFREISACRGVASDVNAALDEIEAISKKAGADREARLAKRYGDLAKQLEPRAQGKAPLAVAVREYVTVLRATEAALRKHSEGSKPPSSSRDNEARRELERLIKREKAAVTRIDVECHS